MSIDEVIAMATSTEPGKKTGNTILKPPVALKYKPTGGVVHIKAVSKHPDSFNRVLVEEFIKTSKWWRNISDFERP